MHVKLLLDTAATRENILGAREFLAASKVTNQVVLFVAGHGLLGDRLDYYFGTTDIDFAHPDKRGLGYGELEGLLDGIAPRSKLLLMDTCHAGEVDTEADAPAPAQKFAAAGEVKARGFKMLPGKRTLGLNSAFELMRELFADLRRGSGAQVISSASGVEFAFESAAVQNGVFTWSVLEGLKTAAADTNKDGQVPVSELRDYVVAKVRELTNGQQTPVSRREALDNDFRVY